jgi:hypothetical protein
LKWGYWLKISRDLLTSDAGTKKAAESVARRAGVASGGDFLFIEQVDDERGLDFVRDFTKQDFRNLVHRVFSLSSAISLRKR